MGTRDDVGSSDFPDLLCAAHPGVVLSPLETDTGVVQIDSLRLDAVETIHRARDFMTFFDQRVDAEAQFLRAHDVSAVVADLPPLGIAAAQAAGVPAIAYGNFTWDWIYAGYKRGDTVATPQAKSSTRSGHAIGRVPRYPCTANEVKVTIAAANSTHSPM